MASTESINVCSPPDRSKGERNGEDEVCIPSKMSEKMKNYLIGMGKKRLEERGGGNTRYDHNNLSYAFATYRRIFERNNGVCGVIESEMHE